MSTATATTTDGVRIVYEETGDPNGRPIVFVHGITDNRRLLEPITSLLDEYRCVALDLRGHGQSGDAEDYRPLGMVRDLDAVIADCGCDRPLLVGHSLGGFVVSAAVATTVSAAAAINIDQPLRMSMFQAALAPVESMLKGNDAEFRAAMDLIGSALASPGLPDALTEEIDANTRAARQKVVLGIWGEVFALSGEELDSLADALLPSITCPYLALLGAEYGDYGDWLRQRIPHAEVETQPTAGHFLHLVDPPAFAQRVRDFERQCAATS